MKPCQQGRGPAEKRSGAGGLVGGGEEWRKGLAGGEEGHSWRVEEKSGPIHANTEGEGSVFLR